MTTTFFDISKAMTSIGGQSVGSFDVRWVHVKQPTKAETLAEVEKRLFADPKRLLEIAEANTLRLTGRTRL